MAYTLSLVAYRLVEQTSEPHYLLQAIYMTIQFSQA